MDEIDPPADDTLPSGRKRRWAKRLGWVLALLVTPFLLLALLINTPVGKRIVADEIGRLAPESGLRFAIGRIEGDIYGKAVLHDVVLSDPKGPFLSVPRVELDWNPLAWFQRGLEVNRLVAQRGRLTRMPELLPGDPDEPILPDFDIRVRRLAIENLTLAPGAVTAQAQRVDLEARATIKRGRLYVSADGRLGQADRVRLLIDAKPDGDKFDMALDYRAPRDGVLAKMVGARAGYRAWIGGQGNWRNWLGHAVVRRDDKRFAAFRLTNKAGQYGLVGQVYPADVARGVVARALGRATSLAASGRLENSAFIGDIALRGAGVHANGAGEIDLSHKRFGGFAVNVKVLDPGLFGSVMALDNARLRARLDGKFDDLSITHELAITRLVAGDVALENVAQRGVARYESAGWELPIELTADKVSSGVEAIDQHLGRASLRGDLTWKQGHLASDEMRLALADVSARFAVRGDTSTGAFGLAGPARAQGLKIDGLGLVDADAQLRLKLGGREPWWLGARLDGIVRQINSGLVRGLAGDVVRFDGDVALGGETGLSFRQVDLKSDLLTMALDGQVHQGQASIAGHGSHVKYGPFDVAASLDAGGPEVALVLAEPLPAAGVRDVRLALSPQADGFRIETSGGSALGPFVGSLNLLLPASGDAVIDVEQLRIWRTQVRGRLTLEDSGIRGLLELDGGGLDGTLALTPRPQGQFFDVAIKANNAEFGGAMPLSIAHADIRGSGLLNGDGSRIDLSATGQGWRIGPLFAGRLSVRAQIVDGVGDVALSMTGRRGSRFELKLDGRIKPGELSVISTGSFAQREIRMPRRAVLTRQADGAWQLAPTQVSYGNGVMIASGRFGGAETAVQLKLARMPLSLVDIIGGELGLGGTASGTVDYHVDRGGQPRGSARLKINQLSRSGQVLSSSPIDLALVADLAPDSFSARAIVQDDGARPGRIQARITDLPADGTLIDRLQRGRLFSQLRFDGPIEALYRLAAVEGFDLTGPVTIAADASGSLMQPQVRGSLTSDNLRLLSAISGTDIRGMKVRGTFASSRLRITRFAGTTRGDGVVTGSGTIDLANIGQGRGPQIDIKASARRARLINAGGFSAAVTGPLRIQSDGVGGVIAGRVRIDQASWQLGRAEEAMSLPNIKATHINRLEDAVPVRVASAPWRYLVDAEASGRIDVDGMGLDSEWGADFILRGTSSDPRIGGEAKMVRGYYSFSGTRFELTRGRIVFDVNGPIDPRLDIQAETTKDNLAVTVNVRGSAQAPEITFSSSPSLPEEEILSRLLFGDSVTTLSATDALQLGAAVASLRGGSGMDPINRLRGAIGLDRLRIVPADPALGRETGVALGKNLGRRFYIELVTDGQGYSATQIEYRITSWLALLASVSTIGRNSVLLEVSRDY